MVDAKKRSAALDVLAGTVKVCNWIEYRPDGYATFTCGQIGMIDAENGGLYCERHYRQFKAWFDDK